MTLPEPEQPSDDQRWEPPAPPQTSTRNVWTAVSVAGVVLAVVVVVCGLAFLGFVLFVMSAFSNFGSNK